MTATAIEYAMYKCNSNGKAVYAILFMRGDKLTLEKGRGITNLNHPDAIVKHIRGTAFTASGAVISYVQDDAQELFDSFIKEQQQNGTRKINGALTVECK